VTKGVSPVEAVGRTPSPSGEASRMVQEGGSGSGSLRTVSRSARNVNRWRRAQGRSTPMRLDPGGAC
jgi:hypothetical protein